MKIQIAAGIAAGLLLCACSQDGAPEIALDEKITCAAMVEARATNDGGTYNNLWKMTIEAAHRSYGANTELEAYFHNSVMGGQGLVVDLERAVYQQCVADSDMSIASAFRKALTESFEQNKNTARFGVCTAFNEGRIAIEDAMAIVIAREGKFNAKVDPEDPRMPVYQNALTERCAAEPSSKVLKHIEAVTWELRQKEQAERDQARRQAEQDQINETAALSEQIRAGVAAGRVPSCTDMVRLKSDRSAESQEAISKAINVAVDAALAKLSVEQAAYTRDNIDRASFGVDFDDCADSNGNMDAAVDEYNWDKAGVPAWAVQNGELVRQELVKRGHVEAPDEEAGLSEEQELELQLGRAARFDAEEARRNGESSK